MLKFEYFEEGHCCMIVQGTAQNYKTNSHQNSHRKKRAARLAEQLTLNLIY